MITRIVKMTFNDEAVSEFLQIIENAHHRIRNTPGCLSLDVVQDLRNPNIFFTYSKWVDEDKLNEYRDSTLFREVWPSTKRLFAAKPETWTLKELKF